MFCILLTTNYLQKSLKGRRQTPNLSGDHGAYVEQLLASHLQWDGARYDIKNGSSRTNRRGRARQTEIVVKVEIRVWTPEKECGGIFNIDRKTVHVESSSKMPCEMAVDENSQWMRTTPSATWYSVGFWFLFGRWGDG
jgi:hypothetical protein